MTERRYSQEETAEIFERAARVEEGASRPRPPGEGMTLAELQEIGREVGIAPEHVARAANALDLSPRPSGRRFLGLPLQVGVDVTLARPLTDAEWERLVVDLRTTFDARGVVRQDGNLRQWTNGNLQALLEPAEQGQRVRFRTLNGSARSMIAAGLATLTAAALSVALAAIAGGLAEPGKLAAAGVLALAGGVFVGTSALRLPKWAALRRQQMEEIATRLVERTVKD